MISRCMCFMLQPLRTNSLRQPVEQFGMRGPLAHDAEIARRADDALAEVIMPDAIHHHARGAADSRDRSASWPAPCGGRWIRRRAGGTILAGAGIENREEARLHFFLRRVVDADRRGRAWPARCGRGRSCPMPSGRSPGLMASNLRQLRFQRVVPLLRVRPCSCLAASSSAISRYGLALAYICHWIGRALGRAASGSSPGSRAGTCRSTP